MDFLAKKICNANEAQSELDTVVLHRHTSTKQVNG